MKKSSLDMNFRMLEKSASAENLAVITLSNDIQKIQRKISPHGIDY